MVYRICGCRTYMSEHPNLFVPMVEYCSMHDAAPQLLEACEILVAAELPENDDYDDIFAEDKIFDAWEKAKSAIAAAKGDKL